MISDIALRRLATAMAVLAFPFFLLAAYAIFVFAMGSVVFGLQSRTLFALGAALLLTYFAAVGPWYGRDTGLSAGRRLAWFVSPALPLTALLELMSR